MKIQIVSKHPHTTWGVRIECAKSEEVQIEKLLKDFSDLKYEIKKWNLPAYLLINITKKGSGVFGLWNKKEEKQFLKEIKEILAKHGHSNIPKVKLTLADLL